jgi:hypothetical protein
MSECVSFPKKDRVAVEVWWNMVSSGYGGLKDITGIRTFYGK